MKQYLVGAESKKFVRKTVFLPTVRYAFVLLNMMFADSLYAQSGAADPCFRQVLQNREKFGKVVFLFGDSIVRGYGLGEFPDETLSADAKRNPLWVFRSPASLINAFFNPDTVAYNSQCDERVDSPVVAMYAGGAGLPDYDTAFRRSLEIRQLVSSKIIRPGDTVLIEDAGNHHSSPDEFRKALLSLLGSLHDLKGLSIIVVTTPDYLSNLRRALTLPLDFSWEKPTCKKIPFRAMSLNEVSRNIVRAYRDAPAKITVLDYHRAISEFKTPDLNWVLSLFHRDEVHPNVWGQCILAAKIASKLKANGDLKRSLTIENTIRDNYSRLAPRGVENWNASIAVEIWNQCLNLARVTN